jgi:hypothetical protein
VPELPVEAAPATPPQGADEKGEAP